MASYPSDMSSGSLLHVQVIHSDQVGCASSSGTQSMVRRTTRRQLACSVRGIQLTKKQCIIAPLTIQRSTFAFYISSSAVRWAEKHEISLVQVQQVCARPRRRKDDGDDDDDVDDDDNGGDDDDSGNENVADYIHDSTKDEDLKIWTTSAMTRFIGRNQHIVGYVLHRPDEPG